MLINKPPKPTTAYPNEHAVWLAGNLTRPNCRRTLDATDVRLDFPDGVTRLVCNGCHQDVLTIEPR